MKIIDVTGFGNSGKTAISDYLKDYSITESFPNYLEFEVFRAKNGLIDLYYSIYENWGLIRSTETIFCFIKFIKRIGYDSQKLPLYLGNFIGSGHNYERFFKDKFISISKEYINDLTNTTYETYWPYQYFYCSPLKMISLKIKRKFGFYDDFQTINLTNSNDFLTITDKYINKLFSQFMTQDKELFILNNAFDFNPLPCLNMIKNAYSIIIERDPRDIFASTIQDENTFIPEVEKKIKNNLLQKQKFLGTNDIDLFINRYRCLRKNEKNISHHRVLKIRFEDFVLNHKVYSKKLNDFLGLNSSLKKNEKLLFIPENSKKNIGLWRKYKDLPEIKKIESDLSEYCYQN